LTCFLQVEIWFFCKRPGHWINWSLWRSATKLQYLENLQCWRWFAALPQSLSFTFIDSLFRKRSWPLLITVSSRRNNCLWRKGKWSC